MSARGPFQDKPSIRVEALALARGGRTLFEDLSFEAEPGAYVEVLGANGSGKTSLLRVLAGFLRPRAGQITFANAEEPALALHYVGHANALKRDASVRGHLRYWAGLLGRPSDQTSQGRSGEDLIVQALGLARVLDAPVRILSQGQQRRLALARLLVAPRPVWLLDEPSSALDEDGRAVLNGLVAAHRGGGGIVVCAAHEALGPVPTHTIWIQA